MWGIGLIMVMDWDTRRIVSVIDCYAQDMSMLTVPSWDNFSIPRDLRWSMHLWGMIGSFSFCGN